MSLSTNTTYRLYAEKLGGTDPSQFVGNEGEVFLNPSVPTLKLSDGSTAGGVDIGGGGGIGTDGSVNTTGIITASSFSGTTATFSGNISVGGTLTYDDVTNVDSIGLITARTGIEVLSGIVTTPKLHVDSVGSGITFSEDLVVQGNARVTGILSIGTSSIVLDSNAKVIRGVEQIRIHSPEQNVKPIIIRQVEEKIVFRKTEFDEDGTERELEEEASVGIGSTASINTTGIITASSFVGDGSGLTNLPASDVTSVNTLTGAVSLGIEDLDDFLLNLNTSIPIYTSVRKNNGQNVTNDGQYAQNVTSLYNELIINWDQADGSRSVKPTDNGTIWLSADGINYSALAIDGSVNSYIWSSPNQGYRVRFDATNWAIYTGLNIAIGGTLYWASSDPSGVPVPLADGDLLRYESVSSKFRPAQLSVDILSDVDTSTVPPTDGQALVWDDAAQKWGAVSLGIEDLDDFQPQAIPPVSSYNAAKQTDGDWQGAKDNVGGFALNANGSGDYTGIYINKNSPTSGTSLTSQGFTAGTTLDLWVSADGVTFTQHTAGNSYSSSYALFTGLSPDLNAYSSAPVLYFSLTSSAGTPVPLADGDILQYESVTSKFRPVQLPTIARSEVSGITTSIADAASADLTITSTGKAGQLLSIETDAAAWVTVYVSQATRTADAGRAETTDPAAGSGVISEVITTGAQTVLVTPSTMYFNNESTPASELYLKVVNKSGSSAAITVTLKVISTEV